MKLLSYNQQYAHSYFWRSKAQQEIDYVEERDGKFYAYEFKLSEKKKAKFPKTFSDSYNPVHQQLISTTNFHEFLTII